MHNNSIIICFVVFYFIFLICGCSNQNEKLETTSQPHPQPIIVVSEIVTEEKESDTVFSISSFEKSEKTPVVSSEESLEIEKITSDEIDTHDDSFEGKLNASNELSDLNESFKPDSLHSDSELHAEDNSNLKLPLSDELTNSHQVAEPNMLTTTDVNGSDLSNSSEIKEEQKNNGDVHTLEEPEHDIGISNGNIDEVHFNDLEKNIIKDDTSQNNSKTYELPEVTNIPDLSEISYEHFNPEGAVIIMSDIAHSIIGIYRQMDNDNNADLLPGGYIQNQINILPGYRMEITRIFRDGKKFIWRTSYIVNKDNPNEFMLINPPNREMIQGFNAEGVQAANDMDQQLIISLDEETKTITLFEKTYRIVP